LGFASGAGAKSGDNANNSNNGKDGAQGAKGGAPGLTPKFGESISGSITATYVQLNTLANIDGATITHTTGAPDGTVDVTAKRDTSISTFAGGASYVNASASTSKENTSVAGSLAMVISQSQTSSKITNSVVNKFQTVSVQAVSGGDNTAVAVDIAGNFSSTQGSQNYTGAGAVSLADIDDGVNATIDTSIVDGPATGTGREVIINAYERTDIGVGGGALYLKFTKQNGGSGGVALTYAGVHDPSSGPAVNASVVNSKVDHYDDLTVAARDSDRLIAGGAMIAGSNKGGRRHRRDRHQQLDQCRNQQGRGPYPGFHQCERQCLSDCRRRR
jgi:hypothetical protein